MRVNIEDDLFVSGRLRAFAFHMGLPEHAALGVLCFVWRDTQHASFSEGDIGKFFELVRIRLPEFDPAKIADAMVAAGLANQEGNLLQLKGNTGRIRDLKAWYEQKVSAGRKGGLQASAKRALSGIQAVAKRSLGELEATAKRKVPVLSPMSLYTAAPIFNELGACDADSDLRARPAALALEKFYLEELAKKPHGSLRTRLTPNERLELDQIAGGVSDPKAVIARFLADEREHYRNRKWSLACLAKDLNDHSASETQAESLIDFLKRKGAENG